MVISCTGSSTKIVVLSLDACNMINVLALQVFMVLTDTWLDSFCGGVLVSSQGLGVFWEILMMCSGRTTAKGVAPNQVSCNEFLNWINTNDLSCMPFNGPCYTW